MKILAVNAGSSSLKVSLYDSFKKELLAKINFERIGLDNPFYVLDFKDLKEKKEVNIKNVEEATKIILNLFIEYKIISDLKEIKGVGHRVVHGSDKYKQSVVITEEVIKDIEIYIPLAPLHNPANLLGIKVFKKVLPKVKMVAVFDTAFHQTLPEEAYLYSVPYEWYTKYGVRKYGFHGISHNYIAKRTEEVLQKKNLKIISCHLGNGGSISAIKDGQCLDTTLGFTPLGGIAMGTRSGNIDPSIISYMMKQTNKSIEEVMEDLNKKSGVFGISGYSDFRDIEKGILEDDYKCKLAMKIYINRVLAYLSYYNTLLEGTDVIVFTAGIGENSTMVREKIMRRLKLFGVIIDETKNQVRGKELEITKNDSKIKCYVIPTNEELMIVSEVIDLLK
ncbi:MAG: acetate/propionate family kinase [Bacilli bacterium]